MNRSQFTSFMLSPDTLSGESSKMLGEVLKEFPYCQTAQLLYIKSLHLQKSIHYNNQLKIAAAYATDRTVLYELITRKEKTELAQAPPITKQNISEEELIVNLTLKEETVPSIDNQPVNQPTPLEILEARLKELKETKTPDVIAEKTAERNNEGPPSRKTILVPEPENIVDPVNTDDTLRTVKDLHTLSDTYLSTAIDASIQIEIKTDENEVEPEKELQEEPEPETEETELSFTDWLKRSGSSKFEQKDSEKTVQSEEKREKQTKLIERFIQDEPRIQKPQKEFYSPVNMARQSVVEDPDFVTETLAGIYAKQGNSAKAIRAYQTLSLKYPEKKLYFASLIEKLEGGNASKASDPDK